MRTYTARQVCEMAGIGPGSLNSWEGMFPHLRPPTLRAVGRHHGRFVHTRAYSDVDLLRLRAIQHLRAAGLPLMSAVDGADDQVVKWWKMASQGYLR